MAAIEKNLYTGSSTSVLYTDRRDFYVEPYVVKELWTDIAPFTTFISNYNQKTGLKDPMFKLFEHRNPWKDQRFQIETGATVAADNGADTLAPYAYSATTHYGIGSALTSACVGWEVAVHANDGGKPSGERKGVLLITAFTSATEISAKNLGAASVTVANGDWLVVVGNAHGEGSESPEPWADELKTVWGQCQIFRTPLQLTETIIKAALRGEADELMRLRKLKGEEHKIQKERAFLFGTSKMGNNLSGSSDTFADGTVTDADGETVRTTTGIMELLLRYGATSGDDQNIFSITEASYAYSNFVDDMEKTFQYYPEDGVKTMFCGAKMLSYWSKLEGATGNGFSGKSKWTVKLSDMKRDTLGFNYRMLETPHGVIQLVHAPVLTRSPYNGYGIVVDKDNLFHAIYDSPKYRQNIKTDNAPLYQKDEYYSYEGLGATLIESHKLFKLV